MLKPLVDYFLLHSYQMRFLYIADKTVKRSLSNYSKVQKLSFHGADLQEELLKEKCLLVDKNDCIIGTASKRDCHLLGSDGSPPPLHRAFSVFLFNNKKELLVQQRSSYKITFPLHYTNTCCSHPLSVEEERDETNASGIKVAACRRLMFELGIPKNEIRPCDFQYLTRIHYSSPSINGKWGEHEIDYVLFLIKDVTLQPNFDEVKEIQYISKGKFDTFLENLKAKNIPVTPWFQIIIDKFLFHWWENLDHIDNFTDHTTIHCMSTSL